MELGRVSNNSLIARIESALAAVRARGATAQFLADVIRGNGRALEGMAYPLINELEKLANDLDIASWHEEDEFLPDLPSILSKVDRWLHQLPRDAA